MRPSALPVGGQVTISGTGHGSDGTWTISGLGLPSPMPSSVTNYDFSYPDNFTFDACIKAIPPNPPVCATGLPDVNESQTATASTGPILDGHVDPRQIMDVGVMNGNIPAPLVAFDEDDEMFLTLTNVGMIMRPDLFEQHTIHFHGYPNASSVYDGVPDASVAINIGGSFTYYYLSPDAGTYFWHCHITPPEHLQMGMVGQLYVRPRQIVFLAAEACIRLSSNKTGSGRQSICARHATPLPIFCVAQRCQPLTLAPSRERISWAIRKSTPTTMVMHPRHTMSSIRCKSTASTPTSTL